MVSVKANKHSSSTSLPHDVTPATAASCHFPKWSVARSASINSRRPVVNNCRDVQTKFLGHWLLCRLRVFILVLQLSDYVICASMPIFEDRMIPLLPYSGFSKTHTIGNIDINVNFVFPFL